MLPSKLYFWPANNPEKRMIFDLLGCEASHYGMVTTDLEMVLTNGKSKQIELRFLNKD